MTKLFSVMALVLTLAACHSAEVVPVQSTVPTNLDLKKVETAIKLGATARKWVAKPLDPNTMELSYATRGHRVVVDVKYDTSNYQIVYKDSSNMNYNESSKSIHGKYHKWIANLRDAIDKNLALQTN